jgi:hypothetical protein
MATIRNAKNFTRILGDHMTFDPNVPLISDSPAIFPAQNQTNMAVLEANIARDHQFNNTPNTFPPTDNTGYHNLVHLTPQAPTGVLAGIGRLYSKTVSALTQLFYMDSGGNEYQITPFSNGPTVVTGSVTLAPNTTSGTIFTVPSKSQGTIFLKVQGQDSLIQYSLFYTTTSALLAPQISISGQTSPYSPSVSYNSRNLTITNNSPTTPTSTIFYHIIVAIAP